MMSMSTGCQTAKLAAPRALVVLLLISVISSRATAHEFTGVVSPTLTPFRMTAVVCENVAKPPSDLAIAPTASVSRCLFDVYVRSGATEHVQALVVQPKGNAPTFAYVDLDRDGRLAPTERVVFMRAHEWALRAIATVSLRSFMSRSDTPLPFEIGIPSREAIARFPSVAQTVWHTINWFVTSTVVIDGHTWYFRHDMTADADGPDLKYGWSSIGGRRWTRDDLAAFAPLEQWSNGEPAVFRLGPHYLSVAAIDIQQRRIVVRERDRADYGRLEVYEGMTLPDFGFLDIDGHPHRLSEFRGRAVLLNFWYPGCGPCIDEFPYLRDALQRFGPERLVVVGLGISPTASASRIRQDIGGPPTGWIEADPWNVSRIVKEWFHIHSTPVQILVGNDGRVRRLGISRKGRSPLRGAELLGTLSRVVPPRPADRH